MPHHELSFGIKFEISKSKIKNEQKIHPFCGGTLNNCATFVLLCATKKKSIIQTTIAKIYKK